MGMLVREKSTLAETAPRTFFDTPLPNPVFLLKMEI
jgi:hypothetical protein